MRDLVFKNLTSKDKSKKVLCAREEINENGIKTLIQKHLIYTVREITKSDSENFKRTPEIFIIKEKDNKDKSETFFIKMKGGMFANCDNKLLNIDFLHSLKVRLSPQKDKS